MELNDLLAQVRRGKVDVIVAYKLDQLARSLAHLVQIIVASRRTWEKASPLSPKKIARPVPKKTGRRRRRRALL